MTGDLKTFEKIYVGSGAPVTGDEITANTNYGIGTLYVDKANGAQYVRTSTNKVTDDWTQIGSSSGDSSYLVYTALLSQSGTDAPVATVLQNTLGNIVWTRDSTGYYIGTLTGAFPKTKTIMLCQGGETISQYNKIIDDGQPNSIAIIKVQMNNVDPPPVQAVQDGLDALGIEIRVYP